ncbi:DUF7935 family protein [Flammeovirga agarivorans]|uniref:Uncharacterized protein n=1 Tax=Flammeovirga agarivorans TaxID=2726742 RepID=A0A7X8SL02_9BACT|nr:hypothetical protein [Flammeovirga agarivorans]NLR92062.1 hypothetical protein [Flammeovirga agarivorans]
MTTDFLDLLKMTIPAGAVLYGAYFIVKMFLQKEYDSLSIKYKGNQLEQTLPLRLQAFERLALFLERISYRELLDRVDYSVMDVVTLQHALVLTIKEEFNHNLSQQIYVSNELWEMIRGAKEEEISFINQVAKSLGDKSTGFDLAKTLLEQSLQQESSPVDVALTQLKSEVSHLF